MEHQGRGAARVGGAAASGAGRGGTTLQPDIVRHWGGIVELPRADRIVGEQDIP